MIWLVEVFDVAIIRRSITLVPGRRCLGMRGHAGIVRRGRLHAVWCSRYLGPETRALPQTRGIGVGVYSVGGEGMCCALEACILLARGWGCVGGSVGRGWGGCGRFVGSWGVSARFRFDCGWHR